MQAKVEAAKLRLAEAAGGTDPGPAESAEVHSPEDLRQMFRKFRRLMGAVGNPDTVEIDGALRAGWIIASGTVEGYGDDVFHVVMLTNGALHYFSGEITEKPIDLTGKWFLGDSIPALEAKMPDRCASLLAAADISWDEASPA